MTNLKLKNLAYSAIVATVAMIIFCPTSYAAVVTTSIDRELECSKCSSEPTTIDIPGRADTTLSVVMKGLKLDGKEELVTKLRADYTFKERIALPSDIIQIINNLSVEVLAGCEGEKSFTNLWQDKGVKPTLTCNRGKGMTVHQFEPTCAKDPDKRTVVTITEAVDEDYDPNSAAEVQKRAEAKALKAQASAEAEKRANESMENLRKLLDEKDRVNKELNTENQKLHGLVNKVLSPSSVAPSASSKKVSKR